MLEYLVGMATTAILIGCILQFSRELTGIRWGAWLPLIGLPISFLPIAGLPIGRWCFSFSGYLSIPLLALSVAYCWRPLREWSPAAIVSLRRCWMAFGSLGLLYFPLALGWTSMDPHAWGWSADFIWLLVLPAAVLFWTSEVLLAGLLVLTAICWQLGIYQTSNGWNYLIDPVSTVSSLGGMVATACYRLLSRNKLASVSTEAELTSLRGTVKRCA